MEVSGKMAPRDPCVYCQETTGVRNANKGSGGALQCGVCKNWAHYECTKLSEDAIKSLAMLIAEGVVDKPYRCVACKGALSQFKANYNELKAVLSQVQNNLKETDTRVQVLEDSKATSSARMDRMEATVKGMQQNSTSGSEVFEELAERERRATNIIIHQVEESSSNDKKTREDRDMGGLLQLFKEIKVDTTLDDVKLIRREGEKKEGESRPLKVVFRKKEDRDRVLANAFNLVKSREEVWRKVSLKADLTKKQRNLERELEKTAASKNLTRSQEEIQERRAWKVVGKRGERVMRLVKLFQEEEVEKETGYVRNNVEERGEQGKGGEGRKRGRRQSASPGSPSSSPTSRRAVRSRIQPGLFGDL